ncbi:3D domain-containing protein [Cohnella terricola]|uniref:LysM peptidoglycan-binding domain-containing protein n=1 Tax=Cohnella terricola TaxID=1289167 RepID=A0A559JFW6_9BACL|nr:3D domain-containing protein [Cohnella terricola]TVX98774.1 LysM peptidoglycan-binding domain-containing protein [Cohnella terricola]
MKNRWTKLGTRSAALVLGAAILLPGLTAHAATTYTAKDSDTFWKLSQQMNIPLQKLMDANPNINPLNIYAGLKLTIPGEASASNKLTMNAAASAKPIQAVATASGKTLSYSKVLNITATAYSAAPEENGKWGAVDYFGNPLKLGTIAVDPNVIPFGTKLYVTGYDFSGLPTGGFVATASDAGSAIKGNRIDIFVPGSAKFVSDFGIQSVKVYILN